VVFGGKLAFQGLRQVWQEKTALTAVSLWLLFGFSASWAKHIVQNDYGMKKFLIDREGKVAKDIPMKRLGSAIDDLLKK
jgi:hypothetical protein